MEEKDDLINYSMSDRGVCRGGWWRVCYRLGLPGLVFISKPEQICIGTIGGGGRGILSGDSSHLPISLEVWSQTLFLPRPFREIRTWPFREMEWANNLLLNWIQTGNMPFGAFLVWYSKKFVFGFLNILDLRTHFPDCFPKIQNVKKYNVRGKSMGFQRVLPNSQCHI